MTLTKKGPKTKYFLPCFLLSIAFLFMLFLALDCNPDSDAYFLIENGRWIFTHKSVPLENPWCLVNGQGIILQQ